MAAVAIFLAICSLARARQGHRWRYFVLLRVVPANTQNVSSSPETGLPGNVHSLVFTRTRAASPRYAAGMAAAAVIHRAPPAMRPAAAVAARTQAPRVPAGTGT